ncbi:MAG: class I SAM-dependent methyltransferase [Theionarchaea archaeon]|nr:class I SAM-dependent methyltransferase [Theionarchaea archaeon]
MNELELSEGEKQLLDALLSIELYPHDEETGKKLTTTPEDIRKRGILIQKYMFDKKAKLADWTGMYEGLLTKGLIQYSGSVYALKDEGRPYAFRARSERLGRRFDNLMIRWDGSTVHSLLCERVYGKDLCQAGRVDMHQLEKLLEVLNLTSENRVLDMGCGIGKITEFISDLTHAHILGIDLASKAIQRAQARTEEKRARLEFREADMNNLSLPPASIDTVIALDTLHYLENLEKTIGQMKSWLQPHGQMGLFSFQYSSENDTPDLLLPSNTDLAQALKKHDLPFQTWDFTERDKEYSRRLFQVATELKEEFKAEDNLDLYEDQIGGLEEDIQFLDAGKKRRYLYYVRMP